MKIALKVTAFMASVVLGAGMFVAGCKSAPELTQANAMSMIQAHYDAAPPASINITVNNDGMIQGATAKYWNRTTIYPNKYWADFTLTPEGKKVLKLSDSGSIIKWRPDSPTDNKFVIVISTVAANRLKPRDIKDIQDGVGGGKTVTFTEGVDFTGVPDALQAMAHTPGNKLTTTRQADFVLDGGAWKLQSVQ